LPPEPPQIPPPPPPSALAVGAFWPVPPSSGLVLAEKQFGPSEPPASM
jgi:hypothetical protein